ncbi:MAG TPA: DUF202 domain-containing protein [Geminicoccaceae bacterium]|nr:DUF202 domain-containing protein [Geminicoccaceae bacterium]
MTTPGEGGDGPPQRKLAEERTEFAEDRTALANERTYSAWLRTGLAALAVGLGAARLLGEAMPGWAVKLMATALIALGVIIFAVALWRYTHLGRRLERSEVKATPTPLAVGMSAPAVVASCVTPFAVWFT